VSLFDLSGKVAVITGSSRGIGRAIVERMAEQGASVVVSSRNIEPCQEVAAAINAKFGDGRAIAIAANISSKEQLTHLVEETTRGFRPDRRAHLQRRLQPALRADAHAHRRAIPQDARQ
jgi:NAD(P)-dependent dehydrogenase (short-subunit alcohol dehydrogenase family)